MVDLLIKQVTEGLSPAEQRELDVLDDARVSEELRGLERAAAALTLLGTPWVEPPPALLAVLERRAEEASAGNGAELEPPAAAPVAAHARAAGAPPANRGRGGGAWGWLAAAACLVLAIFGWLRAPQPVAPSVDIVQLEPPVARPPEPPPAPQPPSPAEERAALLARADSIKVTLGASKDPAAAGVTGDVVWDPQSHQGFLHFVGLASNDPAVRQYQIWIFDGTRDKRYPVDGGVFDVPADAAEVVIPIRAALTVRQAKAFAVTVEKPGGVVVSGLGHVVALGAAG